VIDLNVLVRLGTFFAGKFRAAVDYASFQATGNPRQLESALAHYRPARDAYAEILDVVDGVYQQDLRFGVERSEHGHWADRLPEIDADIAALADELAETAPAGTQAQLPPVAPRPDHPGVEHLAPEHFDRGAPLPLSVAVTAPDSVAGATLHYRHVDQSQSFRTVPMHRDGDRLTGTIDATYTDTPYPLMYFFEVIHHGGGHALLPGLAPDLSNQPYFTLGTER
jgi:hypothetical protein